MCNAFNEGVLLFVVESLVCVCTVGNNALDAFVFLLCPLF